MAKVGRPKIFNNCMDLDFLCELYFERCREDKEPPTFVGLALELGIDRQTLLNYSNSEEFFDTIKRHRMRVEEYLERSLYNGAVAGVIFNLKNNFGWRDKQEVDQTTTISIKRKEYKI